MPNFHLTNPLKGKPGARPRRAAYALPTLFTAGNIYLGFLAIMRTFEGAMAARAGGVASSHTDFEVAAKAIGIAVVLDGLDGRIARMTNTVSDFGREMDSLADVITFGIAPAVLAAAWGVEFVTPGGFVTDHRAGYFLAFLFLLCGAARLARFNVQTNPVPKNPGRPDRKYFVGLPIPAAAGIVAAIIYAAGGIPLNAWWLSAVWLAFLSAMSFLMVSTWRYPSFKEIDFLRPRSPLMVIFLASLIFVIWNFSQIALLVMAVTYVSSGILIRAGGVIRRLWRRGSTSQPVKTPAENPIG